MSNLLDLYDLTERARYKVYLDYKTYLTCTAYVLVNYHLYLSGGLAHERDVDRVLKRMGRIDLTDPKKVEERLAPMLYPKHSHALTLDASKKFIYALGGVDTPQMLPSFRCMRYEVENDTWRPAPSLEPYALNTSPTVGGMGRHIFFLSMGIQILDTSDEEAGWQQVQIVGQMPFPPALVQQIAVDEIMLVAPLKLREGKMRANKEGMRCELIPAATGTVGSNLMPISTEARVYDGCLWFINGEYMGAACCSIKKRTYTEKLRKVFLEKKFPF